MIVKLSDWLTSMVTKYSYPKQIAKINTGTAIMLHNVRLTSIATDPAANTITLTYIFTTATTVRLNSTTIIDLYRFGGSSLVPGINLVIPSSYTWGQVALVQQIRLIGAV